jgi:hypothetical protein
MENPRIHFSGFSITQNIKAQDECEEGSGKIGQKSYTDPKTECTLYEKVGFRLK